MNPRDIMGTSDKGKLVIVEHLEYGIAKILLNDPPLNLNSLDATAQLEAAVNNIERDDNIRVVILTGAGEKAFSAGSNVKEFPHLADSFSGKKLRRENAVFTSIAHLPQPVICAVNGLALGGGCELALTADFRVVDENAKMGFPEIKMGNFPGSGGMFRLPRLVGLQHAKRMMFTGEIISAQKACEIGLCDVLAPSGRAWELAFEMAYEITRQPVEAVRAMKKALNLADALSEADAIELCCQLTDGIVMKTNDSLEGYRAFIEKRPAVFEGAPPGRKGRDRADS